MIIGRNSTGIPHGMTTPRRALDEMIRSERRQEGQAFMVRRLEAIRTHLAKCALPRCPVSLLDFPMRESELQAVLDEAWAVVKENDPAALVALH